MPADENPSSTQPNAASGATDARSTTSDADEEHTDNTAVLTPVVGVAASAGGLKAFRELVSHLPDDTGMAFVLIQHLDPRHSSILPELLARDSPLPVCEITDGSALLPDVVYVIPPNRQLSILHNSLHFIPEISRDQHYHPADVFFRSLAEDRGSRAIGVVLSGTASDGTLGCRSIKGAGGTTFAQDSESAEYDGMPTSAVAAGCVDFVLRPEAIARELGRISRHPIFKPGYALSKTEDTLSASADEMSKIFILLRSHTGHDFSYYKPTTIKRRISRRMMVHRIGTLTHYIKFLQRDTGELDELFQDLLINVTSFFRDPDVFDELERTAIPKMLEGRPPGLPLRIWVPGCSDGQEAYSLAITFYEKLDQQDGKLRFPVQIFGSDIDESAIVAARRGQFPESSIAELPTLRKERYFNKVGGGYQVSKFIRDMCVFAVQDIIRDPPFSRLDLISCRNLLIYFNTTLQKKVLRLMHHALQPTGFLLLGSSETIGAQSDLYSPVSKRCKIYRKKSVATRLKSDLVFQPVAQLRSPPGEDVVMPGKDFYGLEQQAQRVLLENYAPPGVIVGPGHSILRFIGRTWPFIEPSPGAASLDLLKNAHPDIVIELRAAIHAAVKNGGAVRKDGVRLTIDGEERRVNIHVVALAGDVSGEQHLLVLFEPCPVANRAPVLETDGGPDDGNVVDDLLARNGELEREVKSTREYMQSVVEEQEGTNEELRSANEEIQSANEELQSTNEELETAKEELQSANEELATVNEELELRNQETDRINSDLINLLASVEIPIVILGPDLSIRQFTKPARQLLNLIDSDVGRPIGNIKTNIEIPDLEAEVLQVIDAMVTHSIELQDNSGRWYSIRMRPYRTLDKRIDGAVIAFIDIDDVKRFERTKATLEEERRLATIVRDSNDAITLQDFDGNIKAWNPAAERIFGYTEEEALAMNVRKTLPEAYIPALESMYEELRKGLDTAPVKIERIARNGRLVPTRLIASVILDDQGKPVAVATTEKMV